MCLVTAVTPYMASIIRLPVCPWSCTRYRILYRRSALKVFIAVLASFITRIFKRSVKSVLYRWTSSNQLTHHHNHHRRNKHGDWQCIGPPQLFGELILSVYACSICVNVIYSISCLWHGMLHWSRCGIAKVILRALSDARWQLSCAVRIGVCGACSQRFASVHQTEQRPEGRSEATRCLRCIPPSTVPDEYCAEDQHLNAFCSISTAFWMRCKSMLAGRVCCKGSGLCQGNWP